MIPTFENLNINPEHRRTRREDERDYSDHLERNPTLTRNLRSDRYDSNRIVYGRGEHSRNQTQPRERNRPQLEQNNYSQLYEYRRDRPPDEYRNEQYTRGPPNNTPYNSNPHDYMRPNSRYPYSSDSSNYPSDLKEDQRHYRRGYGSTTASAYTTMRKWGIRFAGTCQEDAESFLRRIEEGRSFFPIRDENLLRILPFFLSGVALNWYRGAKHNWRTFEAFTYAFRNRFADVDFQFELR